MLGSWLAAMADTPVSPSIPSIARISRPEQPFRPSLILCLSSSSTAYGGLWLASTMIVSHLIPDSHRPSCFVWANRRHTAAKSFYRTSDIIRFIARHHSDAADLSLFQDERSPRRKSTKHHRYLAPPYNTSTTIPVPALTQHSRFRKSYTSRTRPHSTLHSVGLRHYPHVTRNHFNPYQDRSSSA
jgi:hypothetical protein